MTTSSALSPIELAEAILRTAREAPAVVRSEQRVYGEDSDASYFQDVALSALRGEPKSDGARERLNRYRAELDVEIRDHRSREGQRARRVVREMRRSAWEYRSPMGVSSTSEVGFTTPQYLVDAWAKFRSPAKAFTEQTTLLPLPEYGLQVNIPSFASSTSVASQTELSGVSETDPSGANLQAELETLTGQVSISQQLYDRGGATGLGFDTIVLAQLADQLHAAVDSYVLAQALANAATVTDAASFTWALFLEDLASGREKLADTAGTRLLATHVFLTSDLFGYVTRQVDDDHRPILSPDSSAIVAAIATGDSKWNSWTGVHLGQAELHTDDNLPAVGANTQVVVSRPQETYSFVGDEMSFAYEDTGAQTLSVLVGLRCYVAAITRFPKSVASLSGATYPLTLL